MNIRGNESKENSVMLSSVKAFRREIVSTAFVDGKLVSDRVNVRRDECKVNSVMLSSMKAFRSGNP